MGNSKRNCGTALEVRHFGGFALPLAEIMDFQGWKIHVRAGQRHFYLFQSPSSRRWFYGVQYEGNTFYVEDEDMDLFCERLKRDPNFSVILRILSVLSSWETKAAHLQNFLRGEEGINKILNSLYLSIAQTKSKYQLNRARDIIAESYLRDTEEGKRFLEKLEKLEAKWIANALCE